MATNSNPRNNGNNNSRDEISLVHVFQIMLSKLWLILLLAVVGGALAFSVSKFRIPVKYQSYTSMYVKSTASQNSDDASLSDLNTSKSLVNTYIAVLQDDAVMEELGDALIQQYGADEISAYFTVIDGHISASALAGCITMDSVNDTEVMSITAVTTNAQLSADICNTLAEIAPDFLIRVVGVGSVEQIGSAKPHETPVSPDVQKNTMMGALIGAVLAAAFIFLVDLFDNTIKDPADLVKQYDKAIIGEVFDFSENSKRKKNKDEEHRILTDAGIPFAITEAYKSIRTNIAFTLAAAEKKVFAVSSSNPGEGKSTTSANIAIALAQANHKVLLIDGDLRKPVQHKIFNLKNKKGFSAAICKMEKVEDCIHKNVAENLDVMTSGTNPPNPSELLASAQTTQLLSELSQQYDYIIIDTPPINMVSDVMGVSRSVAGVLVVLKYGATTFDDVKAVMKKSELANMNVLGYVLNDISRKNRVGAYYNQKYKYKYDYTGYGYGYGYGTKPDDKETNVESTKEEETTTKAEEVTTKEETTTKEK